MEIKNNNTFSTSVVKSWIIDTDFLNFVHRKRLYFTILISLVCSVNIHPAFWVAKTGNDNNPGTYTEPFASIQYAYSVVDAGDSIIVKDGVYTWTSGAGYLSCSKQGTPDMPIVIKSENKHGAIIDGENLEDGNHLFGIYLYDNGSTQNADYHIIDGFRVRRCADFGIFNQGDHNQVINCEIDSNGTFDAPDGNGNGGIFTKKQSSYGDYRYNYVHNNGRLFTSGGDHGFYTEGTFTTIAYNIIAHNAHNGIQVSGNPASEVEGFHIYNNTIARNGSNGINLTNDNIDSTNIFNNIFYQNGLGNYGDGVGYGINAGIDTITRIHIYNNLFAEGDSCYNSECYFSFDKDWGAGNWDGYGADIDTMNVYAHSVGLSNPLFVDDKNDFRLLNSSSYAIDNAYNWGQTEDFELNSIFGTKWDIGALEYAPISLPKLGVNVNLSVLLSGCYSEGKMRTELNSKGFLPNEQPYNIIPWRYTGSESVSNFSTDIVDWILLELRSDVEGSSKVAQKAVLLKSGGTIVELDGENPVHFPEIENGKYYVVIRHRNHLKIMSSQKLSLNISSEQYDFTDSQSKAYGDISMKDLGDGRFGLFSGDGDVDGMISVSDIQDIWILQFLNSKDGYQSGDFDLDGAVTAADNNIYWLPNRYQLSQVPK